MSFPWTDQTEGDFQHEQEAAERAAHLKLVHSTAAGGVEASDEEIHKLALDGADFTDAASFILYRYRETSEKCPDFSGKVRSLIDAVIGVTAGRAEFVEVTDADLADRMGCSEKTVARARDEFRAWPDHTKVCEIKEHYRTPEGESHPHAYRCHITFMAAAAAADHKFVSGERGEAMRESARVEADSAQSFIHRPKKKKKKPTDSQMVVRELKQAADTLKRAAKRQPFARHIDLDELAALRRQLTEAVEAFDAAFETGEAVHLNTDIEQVDNPDGPDLECRVDSLDTLSTQNDPTESTVYELEVEADWDVSRYVWLEGGRVSRLFPPDNSPPWFLDEIEAEYLRLKGVSHARG
jgi:hypothetical protein